MENSTPNNYEELLAENIRLKEVLEYRRVIGNEFIERMHYDFNTLLNSITGYIYTVYESADAAQKPAVDNALKTANLLLNKFNDMADYISLSMGGYVVNKAPASLKLITRQVNQKHDSALTAKSIGFISEVDERIPEYVETDHAVIKKAISLLVENALENSESGTVKVSAELVSEQNGHITVKISVSDEGEGIDADKINGLLSGNRGEGDSSQKEEMRGFGLQIAKDFLALLGAELSARNNDGKGATFSFVFDVECISSDAPETDAPDEGERPLFGVNVLLADDSVIIQQIVRQMLGSEGTIVTTASNGGEAVSLFGANKYDIVLMDIEMPVLNGYEAAREISSIIKAGNMTVPIIGMTAHTGKEEYDKCIESGMSGVIIKPFKHDELMDALYEHLLHKEYVAAETAQEHEKSSLYNFEKIKGIDYKEGVQRLSGNERVYFELLQNFRDGYHNVADDVSALLMEGRDNEAKSLLHLIKGISGNLSFNEVYDYANKLRSAVENDNMPEITRYLKLLGSALKEFKTSFEEAEIEILYNMSESMDMDMLLVKTRMEELSGYLSGDIDLGNAVDACNDIYDYMKETGDQKDFERIKDAVSSFDLELAASLLKNFMAKFA